MRHCSQKCLKLCWSNMIREGYSISQFTACIRSVLHLLLTVKLIFIPIMIKFYSVFDFFSIWNNFWNNLNLFNVKYSRKVTGCYEIKLNYTIRRRGSIKLLCWGNKVRNQFWSDFSITHKLHPSNPLVFIKNPKFEFKVYIHPCQGIFSSSEQSISFHCEISTKSGRTVEICKFHIYLT